MGANGRPDAAAVRTALADAAVGDDLVPGGLADAAAVRVDGGVATVTVELPVPTPLRAGVERDVRDAVSAVAGVSRVDVRFDPRVPDPGARVDLIPDVKHVVAVASGKGGVGKSTVAVNLAAALADAGASVGLLDADVYGPSAPAMVGLDDRTPDATRNDEMTPREAHGVRVMSMGFIVGEDDPVIWRGPLVDDLLGQLFGDVAWGDLDYLVVDMPPGTGDAQLSLVQHLPVTGAVIVTTPGPVAVDDARRGLQGFRRYDVPVLGVVENMTSFECPDCGSGHDLFGSGGADELADAFDVPVLGRLPLDPAVGTLDADEADDDPPGLSVPGLGRLQLPRTREERERPTSLPPVAVRDDGSEARAAFLRSAVRTAARLHALGGERGGERGDGA